MSVSGNRTQYSNTRPKLLEASYGRTSEHNTSLSTMNSPVFIKCRILQSNAQRIRTQRWSPDLWRTSPDRQPTQSGLTIWHYDEDSLTLGTRQLAAPLQLTTPQKCITKLEAYPLMRPADTRVHDSCSSLRNPRSCRWSTPSLPFRDLLALRQT